MERKIIHKKMHVFEQAMKHKQVVIVVLVLMMVLGIYALQNMPRNENPNIDIPTAMVYAIYPGADEHQVDEEVTKKIEQYLFSFEEIKKNKVTAETSEGQTFITTEIFTEVKDRKKFWHTLQLDMDAKLKPLMPQGVIGPFVNSGFSDVTAMIVSVSSPDRSYAEIESYVDKFEDQLKVIPTVSKINRTGAQREQIYVNINDQKLKQYGFDVSRLIGVLQQQNVTNYSGELTSGSNSIVPIYTNSRYKTEADIANQIVYTTPAGIVVRLKDVATLERRFEEKSSYVRIGNENAMIISLNMQPNHNIVHFGKEVEEKIKEVQATFPPDIKIKTIVNLPEVVDESISHFMKEFSIALLAVFVVVMLLLPMKVSLVAAAAAPISMLITFGIMMMFGLELHQVTLAALIIVLGMVVDNAIVVVDDYVEKLDEGIKPWDAAWLAAKHLSLPVFTATIAIIFAFAPLAIFMEGVAKDFMLTLPITIAIALSVSMLVALLFTPYMCYVFIKTGLHKEKDSSKPKKKSLLDRLQNVFDKGISWVFKYPKTSVISGFLTVIVALFIAGNVETEFFPKSERNQFNMEVWMPSGSSLEKTESKVKELEAILNKDKRVVDVTTFMGMSSPRFSTFYAPETPKRNFAQIFITAESSAVADEIVEEYLPKLDSLMPEGKLRLKQLSMQTGSPINVRVMGDNEDDQRLVATQVQKILENTAGANYVRMDNREDYLGVKLKIDKNKANRLGITNQAITQILGAGVKGFAISTLWEGDKPKDIFVRFDSISRKDISAIGNLSITSNYGTKVPLKDIATLEPSWHTGNISRKNGLKTLNVFAETQFGRKAASIIKEVKPEIANIQLPRGIRIEYGGDDEATIENAPGMGISLSVSIVLIFLTVLFQFKNLGKALIVLSTFPLSFLGAFLGLYVTGNPLGMTGFMGIIALIGIVVRNGIILVDFADELVKNNGYSVKEAALAAGKRRMRPIFLTSAAAAVGFIPMIISKSPMWAPLGSVLAFGLIISMIMTLFIVPALYSLFIKEEPVNQDEESTEGIEDTVFDPSEF